MVAGCRAQAMEAGVAERARGTVDPDNFTLGSFIEMRTRYMVDTGRWHGDVASWKIDAAGARMPEFNQAFATGFAAARSGDLLTASKSLAAMNRLLPRLPAVFDHAGLSAVDPERRVPEIQKLELQAVILASEGRGAEAIAMAQKAADTERNLPYAFGPPYPEKPCFELLGELLLQLKRPQKAQAAFRQALLRTPRRTESLRGLLLASRSAGDRDAARQAESELRQILHSAESEAAETH